MNVVEREPVRKWSRRRDRGFTMIELMVGITLGLIVLAVVTTVFATISNNRRDTERVGRQIENGRYAVQLLADELVNAGYFGEFDPRDVGVPAGLPDPCSVNVADLKASLMVHVQGFAAADVKPGCLADVKDDTAVIVVRRLATCVAGDANCDAVNAGDVYMQSTLCGTELADPIVANRYVVAASPGGFALHKRGCGVVAAMRKYEVRLYFVAKNNNAGDGIPTLKRAELSNGAFAIVPLVEGIENLQVEYGLDTIGGNSTPDVYTASPADVGAWANAVTARVHLLARTTEGTLGHSDAKTFNLGPVTVGPFNDNLKRHAYSGTVRFNNPAGRRE